MHGLRENKTDVTGQELVFWESGDSWLELSLLQGSSAGTNEEARYSGVRGETGSAGCGEESRVASLLCERKGGYRIDWLDREGRRHSLRLGMGNRKLAEQVLAHVETLIAARELNVPLDRATQIWLVGIGPELRARRAGLVEPEQRITLAEIAKSGLASGNSAQAVAARQTGARGCLSGWADSCQSVAAPARTWRRPIATASLRAGGRDRTSHRTRARPVAEIAYHPGVVRGLARPIGSICPDLARRGLRTRPAGRARPENSCRRQTVRVVPMFPLWRPHLEAAFAAAKVGSVHVFPETFRSRAVGKQRFLGCNLRANLLPIVRRVGVEPSPGRGITCEPRANPTWSRAFRWRW